MQNLSFLKMIQNEISFKVFNILNDVSILDDMGRIRTKSSYIAED